MKQIFLETDKAEIHNTSSLQPIAFACFAFVFESTVKYQTTDYIILHTNSFHHIQGYPLPSSLAKYKILWSSLTRTAH